MQRPRQFVNSAESEVWNAIDAFEQILQAMPDDRTALETLYEAYDHIGEKSKALDCLINLGSQVCEEEDTAAAGWVYHALSEQGVDTSAVRRVTTDLEAMMESRGLPSPALSPGRPRQSGAAGKGVDVSAELEMAWALVQAGNLGQDEYSQVVKDLTENSTKTVSVPVSVLHVLHDRTSKSLGGVLTYLSRSSGMPFVNLSMYEINPDNFSLLSSEFTDRKGAVVFERIGEEPLVAILNPFHDGLKKQVEEALRTRCHFYLTEAHEYDSYVQRAKQPKSRHVRGAA